MDGFAVAAPVGTAGLDRHPYPHAELGRSTIRRVANWAGRRAAQDRRSGELFEAVAEVLAMFRPAPLRAAGRRPRARLPALRGRSCWRGHPVNQHGRSVMTVEPRVTVAAMGER